MGRKQSSGADELPRGVTERVGATGKSTLYIHVVVAGRPERINLRVPRSKGNIVYAQSKKQEVEEGLARGTFQWSKAFPHLPAPAWVGGSGQDRTVREYLEVYFETNRRLRESTRRQQRYACASYPDWLLDKAARVVTPADIKRWATGQSKLKLVSLQNYARPLKGAFACAIDDHARTDSPFDRVVLSELVTEDQAERDDAINP